MRFANALAFAGLTTPAVVFAGLAPRAPQATTAPSAAPVSTEAVTAAATSVPLVSYSTPVEELTSTPSVTFLSTGPSAIPLASITEGEATQTSGVLHPTLVPTPGASPPISGAPPLPSWSFVPGTFPALDVVPPTNSTQVAAWIAEVAASGVTIPDYSPTVDGAACGNNTAAAADLSRCWWTCGGCVRPTDITTCPDKLTWGLSYDDGPSDYTADLLNFMNDNTLTSTFFIVGSRAISRPEILQAEYMAGHQLSVHTWSHPPLTTLTNEQIIAELGWTREAIRQITGVSPNTMRPPYGDIDDRVRAICQAMNLTPIIWTEDGSFDFDTEDWHIPSGQSVYSVVENFDTILELGANISTGFIVLEHDLYEQTVELATGYLLPDVLARRNPSFNLMSIIECQHKPLGDAYVETNNNQTNPQASNAYPLTGTVAISATPGGTGGAGVGASSTSSSASPSATKKSAGDVNVPVHGIYGAAAVAFAVVGGALLLV